MPTTTLGKQEYRWERRGGPPVGALQATAEARAALRERVRRLAQTARRTSGGERREGEALAEQLSGEVCAVFLQAWDEESG